jgi:crossover junction endodeoxyribonuclease RuvC
VDPSRANTGVVVMDTYGDVLFKGKAGYSLKMPEEKQWWKRSERVERVVKEVGSIIEKNWGGHNVVVIFESASLGSQYGVSYTGELHGALQIMLREKLGGVITEIIEVAPKNLKKFITGKGQANKPEIAAHVASRWDEIFSDDNLTDAYVLCQIGRAMRGNLRGMPKTNLEALKKVVRYVKDTGRDKG